MKKIISALALGATAFGFAAAKTSVNLNYRNYGTFMDYRNYHTTDGTTVSDFVETNLFNLNFWGANSDEFNLKASGDILDYAIMIQPSSAGSISWKTLTAGAKVGAFHVEGGFVGNGKDDSTFRLDNSEQILSGISDSNKVGSLFSSSFAKQANFYTSIGGSDTRWFGEVDYTLNIANSDASVKLIGTWIGDQRLNEAANDADRNQLLVETSDKGAFTRTGWKSQVAAGYTGAGGAVTKNVVNGGVGDVEQKDAMGWIATVIAAKPNLFKAQFTLKGIPYVAWNEKNATDVSSSTVDEKSHDAVGLKDKTLSSGSNKEIGVFVPSFYFQLQAIKNIAIEAGAAVSIYDFNISDYAFDIRAKATLLGGKLAVGYKWNLSVIDTEYFNSSQPITKAAQVGTVPGIFARSTTTGNSFAIWTNRAMWNELWAEFTINPTFRAGLYINALTDVGDGPTLGYQDAHGTTLSITPELTIFAAKTAQFMVGFNFTMMGIGLEDEVGKHADDTLGDSMNFGFAIPFVVRVKM